METARAQGGPKPLLPANPAELREEGKGGNGETHHSAGTSPRPPTPTPSPKPLPQAPAEGEGQHTANKGPRGNAPPMPTEGGHSKEGGNLTEPADRTERCKSILSGEDNKPVSKARGNQHPQDTGQPHQGNRRTQGTN